MTIIEYQQGDHPAGFVGLRVARSIDGQRHQRYFPLRDNAEQARQAAREYDAQLAARQEESRQRRQLDSRSPYSRVRGVFPTVETKAHRTRGGMQTYRYRIIMAIGTDEDGRSFRARFSVERLGLSAAWEQACRYYAQRKGVDPSALVARRPSESVFDQIERAQDGEHVDS